MKVELIVKEKKPHHLYIYVCITDLDYVSISEYSYSTGNYILKEYYGVCFLMCAGIEPKDGFYSHDSLKDHPPQSHQLFQSEEFVTISGYNSKVSLPLKQVDMEWGTSLAMPYFFTIFKRITFPSPPVIFIYNRSGDPWGKIQTTDVHVGDCNHSYLASKLNFEKKCSSKTLTRLSTN